MGQAHKGERQQLNARVPPVLAEIIYEASAEQGFSTVNDYLLTMVANCHGYPVRVAKRPELAQGVLPISGAATVAARPQQHGERVLLAFRAPLPLAGLVKEAAQEQDFESVSDYLLMMYAARHAYPVQVKKKPTTAAQEVLPLTRAS